MRRLAVAAALAGLAACAGLGSASARGAAGASGKDALYKDLVAALDRFDERERWKDADSGVLAWSCGQQLQTLVILHRTTGDRPWLDRLFKYAETMFGNLTPNRDGFLSWRTGRYTSPPAKAPDGGTGHPARPSAVLGPRPEGAGPPAPGAGGAGAPAACADGSQPKDFDFAVHDGVALAPVCRAIELVKKDPALAAAYGERADRLLKTIETQLIPKWDKYWRDTPAGTVLVYPADPAMGDERGITLPHNQYLALGTVHVVLYRITGKAAYRDRAAGMARFFKSHLRLVGDRYEWNYWDAAGPWDAQMARTDRPRAEDTGHGSLDLGFVLACVDSGIVFTEADLKRFANAFLQVMWNGSPDKPAVGGWVNRSTPSRQSGNLQEWLLLGRVEPRVPPICERVILAEGSLWAKAQLYGLWATQGRTPAAPPAKETSLQADGKAQ